MTSGALPLIGITADVSGASAEFTQTTKDSTLFLPGRYLAAIERAGAVPLVLPAYPAKAAIRRLLGVLNGVVLSGGNFDIHPRYYGEKPMAELGVVKPTRTEFELEIATAAMDRDLPVLGICGGAQAINVSLGGSLYQDIAAQLGENGAHEHTSKNADGGHAIRIEPGTRLFDIVRRSRVEVNTSHHQAIKRLGRGLVVNAVADDGVIEGIESARHGFVLGVQWHPEALAPRRSLGRRLFSAFVAFCKQRSRMR
jgi:putative glutamine amidotransferase